MSIIWLIFIAACRHVCLYDFLSFTQVKAILVRLVVREVSSVIILANGMLNVRDRVQVLDGVVS